MLKPGNNLIISFPKLFIVNVIVIVEIGYRYRTKDI